MNNNENLDSMAKRYKDEMMRLYRMNGGLGGTSGNMAPAPTSSDMVQGQASAAVNTPMQTAQPMQTNQPVRNVQTTQRQVTTSGQCRFMSAEEIISSQSQGNDPAVPTPLPSFGPDVTNELINGPVPTPYSLTARGIVNSDTPVNAPAAAPTSVQPAAAEASPQDETEEGGMIRGMYIYPMIRGTNSNTQLSGSDILSELLPAFDFPPDVPAGEAVPATVDPRFVILTSWYNVTGDNGWGCLQFEVTTGSQGNPVQGATVVVSRVVNGKRMLTRILRTDASGLTRTIFLPAPKYVYNPYRPSTSRPFAEYTASVYANGYYPLTNINIMVEAGVKSLQPVDLIPYPETGTLPGIEPRTES